MSAPQRGRDEDARRQARRRRAERRRRMVDEAKRLFLMRGYQDTTAELIAEAAEIALGCL